jgi:hypothetical protein
MVERVLASGTALLAFGAIWYWTYHRSASTSDTGFLPAMLIVYFLEYPFTIFTQKLLLMNYAGDTYLLDEAALVKALLLSFLGLGLILFGYHWPGRHAVAKVVPKFEMRWHDKNAVQLMALVFMAIGLVTFLLFYVIKLPNTVQAYLGLPGDFFFLAMITLFVMQLAGDLSYTLKVVLWGVLVPVRIFLGMAQGQLGLGMLIVMALVITYATVRRRIPWAVFIVGFGAFVLLQPVKVGLRQSVWVNGEMSTEVAQSDKASALIESTERGWAVLQTFDIRDVVDLATVRLTDILVLATVVQQTPRDVPYWAGSSYYRLLYVVIPRILDPEKPDIMEGNVLGHQYEMIGVDNYTTSINLAQVTEFYGNFGIPGVIVGCFLLGIIYRAINDSFIHEKCGLGAIVAGIYLLTHLVDIENAAAVVFGGLWFESITVILFHYGVRFAERFLEAMRIYRSGSPTRNSVYVSL